MIPFFDLERQYAKFAPELQPALMEVMASTAYIGGRYVADFERMMADYLGVKHAISCGNGTDALKLALRGAGVKPGDEVITTPFTFFATAEAIAAVGAAPIFVDIRESDLNIDPDQVEAAITPKTRAILPVHIFGAPAAMDELNAIAARHGLKVIEDACQAVGSSYHGKMAGNLGDAGCFSFYPTKNLGACGDGGLVTTNDDGIAAICRATKAHAAGKAGAAAYTLLTGENVEGMLPAGQKGDALYDPYKYYNFFIGENSRLDGIQAAILQKKLPHLKELNRRRAQLAARYTKELRDTPLKLVDEHEADSISCHHQYAVLCDQKEALAQYLGEKSIGTGAFYPVPLHKQAAFMASQGMRSLPVAESVCRRSVCLPVFPELTDEEQGLIIEEIHRFFAGR